MCMTCDVKLRFDVDHPLGLAVAVATRRAIDAGLLPEPSGAMPWRRGAQRLDGSGVLRGVRQRLEAALPGAALLALPDFFMLAVEDRSWGYFRPAFGGFSSEGRSGPPRFGGSGDSVDAVVVLAETAATAMLAGRLPFDSAVSHELVVVDAPGSAAERLSAGLRAAFPSIGFNRFICH